MGHPKVSHKHPLQKGGEEEKPKRTIDEWLAHRTANTLPIPVSQYGCDLVRLSLNLDVKKLDVTTAYAARAMRSFLKAATSIWRIRSAETPNSAARSCKVAPPSSCSQRACTIRRERGSRASTASVRPAPCRESSARRSSMLDGSWCPSSDKYEIGAYVS